MPYIIVEGRRIFFARHRSIPEGKPPLVLIHGAGGSHQHWLHQVRHLSGSSTYALDLPGHGRSEGPGRSSISAYASWLLAFVDAVGLDRPVLVGHSMGGAIGLYMALHHPSRLTGLGLVATGARLRVAPQILEGVQQDSQGAVRLICGWAFGPEAKREMVRLARQQMSATPASVLYGDFVACDSFDVMDRLAEIRLPATIICGTRDRLTPFKYSVKLRDMIRGSTLHLVEGVGHMVMIESPQSVVQALSSLLQDL